MVGRRALRVPDRWTEYIPLGCRMPGTRFVAFKVPLKKSFDQNLLPEERFSPHDLIRRVEERKEELGLIIDLTYTTRYYGREDLPPTLDYSKILTMGHEIPGRKTILRFQDVVKKFLTNNQDNDKLIGVHCTHGLNRTGYLVCRYLIDVEGMEPNAAIELFNKCRGHRIERANYIWDLRKRALKSCELQDVGSDLRKKSSAPAKPQKQQAKQPQPCPSQAPLAVPRNPRKKQRPDPTAEGQPQEAGHRHGALEHRQLEQKQFEKQEQERLEQREQERLEQRQKKKLKQRQLEQLEQRQQKKLEKKQLEQLEQRQLEQKQQKKLEQRQLEQLEQKKQKKLEKKQRKKLEKKQQEMLEQRQQNHLEQKQQRKLKHPEQNHLEMQNPLEQRQQRKSKHLEQRQLEMQNHREQGQQNHPEQRQQRKSKHPEQGQLEMQNHPEQGQPCSSPPRNCWLSPAPKKRHKEPFPSPSPQPGLPQEASPGRKRRRRKRELREQEMS